MMDGEVINNSLLCFSIYLLMTGILSQDSLSSEPIVYVPNNGNGTFKCITPNGWNFTYFYDEVIEDKQLARVIYRRNSTHCRPVYTEQMFGADKYDPLPCYVSQPVSIIVRHINASYHNKSISCKVDSGMIMETAVIKIRENLAFPRINPNVTTTIKENMSAKFTCIARSIPKSSITWYIENSRLNDVATISSPDERTIISALTYQANKTHNKKKLYCSANDTFNTKNSSFTGLNIIFVPTVHMEPEYDPYILYAGQRNVKLNCSLDEANPSESITYHWTKRGQKAEGQTVTIANVVNTDGGLYTCTASNVVGNSSVSTKRILVQFIPLITNISNISITEGSNLRVTPTINAYPVISSSWWTHPTNASFINVGLTLTINGIQRRDGGDYTCHAMNALTPSGMDTMNRTSEKSITIDVLYIPEIYIEPSYQPYITYHNQKNVILSCVVKDANPRNGIAYKWIRPYGNVVEEQNVTLSTVDKSDRGSHSCTATNSAGASESRTIEITVQYGPSISGIASKENVLEGSSLNISPQIDAYPLPKFVWWRRQHNANIKYDEFNLTIQNIQRDASGNYSCYALNTIEPTDLPAFNITTERVFYVNVQYPPSTEIDEAPNIYILEYDNVTLHCKVKDGNPTLSSLSWYQNKSITLEQTANYTIRNIHRSAAGDYNCEARNAVGNGSTSVQLNILYGPEIKSLTVLNGSTAVENSSILLECKVVSNPVSIIEWTSKNEPVNDNDFPADLGYYNIPSATCYHTGKYRCTASTTIFSHVYNDSKEVQLFVNCSPRLNIYMEQPPNKLGLPLGGVLNVSVYIVAYPKPTTTEWIFRQDNTTHVTYRSMVDLDSNLFLHTVRLFKLNLTENDFGNYSLAVHNDIGSEEYTVHVVPEGPPEPSHMINATCGIHTALVYWETAFSGGDSQTFSVIAVGESMSNHFNTNVVSNVKAEIKFISLDLSPGEYTFSIFGKNKYDSVLSLNTKSCKVKDNIDTKKSSVVAAAAGGGVGAAVILIGLILLSLVIIKKRRIGKTSKEGRKNLTDEDTDEGLHDNPLYGTSHDSKEDSGPVYSIVKKPLKSEDSNSDGPVYSHVQKKQSKEKTTKDGKILKKMKVSGNNKMDIEMGSVYENPDEVMKSNERNQIYANTESDKLPNKNHHGCENSIKRNQDGLIYADLDLAPTGNRFVIRGIENRNNYALIDLSKTAEPLPSDDEDVDQDRKETDIVTQ